ncbi:MAG: hypothetical protein HY893_01685 [Deltaproteobacteria bacterium]|nr:hypothetical protein [Deltaproteobacteria bacterium]
MSQRIKKEIVHLCHCLLYFTALHLCPAVRRRAAACGGAAIDNNSLEIKGLQAERAPRGPFAIFGMVLGSMPVQGSTEAFTFEFHDEVLEFGMKPKDDAVKLSRPGRDAEKSRKTGFDLIRLTFNLARGNLEQAILAI